jgi:uncharacterized protein (DUF2249 family)/quercetin dioxygenase-like cupin family protein
MTTIPEPIALEQSVRFDDRHPTAVTIPTPLPGQTLLIGLRAGQTLRPHRVNTPITIQVISGEGTLTAAGAAYPARPGLLLPLAADVIHGVEATTNLVLLVYRAASAHAEPDEPAAPVRDDPEEDGTLEDGTLDVRALPPRERHARIFARFNALPPGGAFRLINDHDPKPLKYKFAAEHAGEATWEPEREGPDAWVVRIGKVAATVRGE